MAEETKTNQQDSEQQAGVMAGSASAAKPAGGAAGSAGSAAQPGEQAYNLNAGAVQNQQAPKLTLLSKLLNKTGGVVGSEVAGAGASTASAAGASKSAGATAGTAASGNAFTKLFGAAKEMSSMSGGKIPVSAIQSGATPRLSDLLGPKPKMSIVSTEEVERNRTKTAKVLLQISLVIAVIIYGFFYTQLNEDFTALFSQMGPNVAVKFERSNTELKKVQTDLNLVRFRTARLWLDEVNANIDPFQRQSAIIASEFSTSAQRQNARAELQIVGAKIKNALKEAQKIFSRPLGIDIYSEQPISPEQREEIFAHLLVDALNQQKTALTGQVDQNYEEVRLIDNVLRLAQNKRFRAALKNQDLVKISEEDFGSMLSKIREEATDELASIDKIKQNRIDWGGIIQDIHGVTKMADLYYGQGLFKTVGGFLFNSYGFDTKTKRVSISGITKTPDNKTFSFIAKLVDSIEKSPKFKDIDFRSFAKNRDETGDYSSSINLEFSIQPKGEVDGKDDTFSQKTN